MDENVFSGIVKINNPAGIHVRPAGIIVKSVADFKGKILIESPDGESDLRSILSLLGLGLTCGDVVKITVTGDGCAETFEKLKNLFSSVFEF